MKAPIGIFAVAAGLILAPAAHAQEYDQGQGGYDPGDEYQQYPEQPPGQQPHEQQQPYEQGYDQQQAPQQDVNFQVFQNALAPYGEWVEAPGYGTVWHPTSVAADWRPYTQGRWVWTAYGWTWVGNEPWAWAPYHYGRWVSLAGFGWSWVPDYTWGPAWVSFRFGDAYVGWAPLAPGYGYDDVWYDEYQPDYGYWSFVSYNSFYVGPTVVNYNLCHSIYAPSYVAANVWVSTRPAAVVSYGGGRVYGPSCDYVSSRIHAPVTPVAIHAATSLSGVRPGLEGNTVNVVAPPFHGVAHAIPLGTTVPGDRFVGVGNLGNAKGLPPGMRLQPGLVQNHGAVAPQTARPGLPPRGSFGEPPHAGFNQPQRPAFNPPTMQQQRPTFSEPQRPAYNPPVMQQQRPTFSEPQRPAYNPPAMQQQRPTFSPPAFQQRPAYNPPAMQQQRPTFSPPAFQQRPAYQPPSFSAPSRPSYQAPSFSAPSRPSYQAPSFSAPSRPTYQAPSRPSFSAPSFQAPSRPSYSAPSRPSAPAPSFHPSFGGGRHR